MLIFLDCETTGLEENDEICSIGMISILEEKIQSKYEVVNEGKKISSKASSINHITNEMLKSKPRVQESEIYTFLREHNNSTTTIIGHNINFDMQKLSKLGFSFKGNLIDTLRVSKHLMPECESYGLQVLRYELKLYQNEQEELLNCGIREAIIAHNALSDSLTIKLLYTYLLDLCTQKEMYDLSFKNVLLQKFEFGKYKGRYIEEIFMMDRGYLEWLLGNIVNLDEDLRYSIMYYLQG